MIFHISFLLLSFVILEKHICASLTDACTMLPFDNYTDLSCKVCSVLDLYVLLLDRQV